ncbi:MAG: hypothetical protein L6R40_008134 [Gallowayella cf. fulva]|nr:MAG: hypothetical protein L6R40_008134 [Xanthomendoza cf. fulva]
MVAEKRSPITPTDSAAGNHKLTRDGGTFATATATADVSVDVIPRPRFSATVDLVQTIPYGTDSDERLSDPTDTNERFSNPMTLQGSTTLDQVFPDPTDISDERLPNPTTIDGTLLGSTAPLDQVLPDPTAISDGRLFDSTETLGYSRTVTTTLTATAINSSSWSAGVPISSSDGVYNSSTQTPICSCGTNSDFSWPTTGVFSEFDPQETAEAFSTFASSVLPTTLDATQVQQGHYYTFSMADDLRSLPPQQLSSGIPIEIKFKHISARDTGSAAVKPTLSPLFSRGTTSPTKFNASLIQAARTGAGFPPRSVPAAYSNKSSRVRSLKRTLYSALSHLIFHFIV